MKFNAYETLFTSCGASCRGSDCLPLADGSLLAVWSAGQQGAETLYCASRDVKGKWEAPRTLTPENGKPCFYPVLYSRPDGGIALLYRTGCSECGVHTVQMISYDGGIGFTAAELCLPDNDRAGGPSGSAVLTCHDGTLLTGGCADEDAFVYRSADGGVSWKRGAAVSLPEKYRPADGGFGSPAFWSEGGKYVHALLRSAAGFVFRSDSIDGGESWNTPFPLGVANPGSPLCVCSRSDLSVFLLCNPSGTKRTPLALYQSNTNGSLFKCITQIATGHGEFTDPSMKYSEGKLYITYTRNGGEIAFVICQL